MSDLRHDSTPDHQHSVLAAAVGLGDTTLDSILSDGQRPLRVGGRLEHDLPFPIEVNDLAHRTDGSWQIRVPEGVAVDGTDDTDGTVQLYDWDAGVTLRLSDGDAWLRLTPTRSERFLGGRGPIAGLAASAGRALPVLWLALALTLGVGSLFLWAGAALGGNPNALMVSDGPVGYGAPSERIAAFGAGDFAADGAVGAYFVSEPTPAADATADAEPIEEPEVVEPTPEPVEASEEPVPVDGPEVADDALAEEVAEEEVVEEVVADVVEENEPTAETVVEEPAAESVAAASSTRGRPDRAGASGGGGHLGIGGGTDDGYADRRDSVRALEHVLLSCLDCGASARARFVASRAKRRYHHLTSRQVAKIKPENVVFFATEGEAEAAGFVKSQV